MVTRKFEIILVLMSRWILQGKLHCAGGHTTDAPDGITYSSVVSRDSVRIGLLAAALHDVDALAIDLENAYLNAPCAEKIWFEGGTECGEDKGKHNVDVLAIRWLQHFGPLCVDERSNALET